KKNLATLDYNKKAIKLEPKSDDKNIILDYSTSDIKSNKEKIFNNIGNYNKRFS
ncbi:5947_t:CDS:1, partial [Cetraspora pellucida]